MSLVRTLVPKLTLRRYLFYFLKVAFNVPNFLPHFSPLVTVQKITHILQKGPFRRSFLILKDKSTLDIFFNLIKGVISVSLNVINRVT